MIGRLLDFVIGREPVASATGLAGVVTAALGLVAALGADIDPEVVAAIGVLVTALAGWLARKAVTPLPYDPPRGEVSIRGEQGLAPIWVLAGLALLIAAVFVTCDAVWDDEDEADDIGAPAWVMDRGDGDDNRGGRNENGRDCEGSEDCSTLSPSFEDSPIIVCVEPGSCSF
jgi:hypothetical protein